ncbi:MAG: acyl transferase [Microscillaceae bacterium]|nr:acyl transferase [Microscillaceae bacterium]MDW8459670.1 acyl transferase [Cytophagales bacterium]
MYSANFIKHFKQQLFSLSTQEFEAKALQLFHFQATYNTTYREYLRLIRRDNLALVQSTEQIPFLPIQLFKTFRIETENTPEMLIFESSGTTGQTPSRHYLKDINFYQKISQHIFEQFYGSLQDWIILALLPSYLERGNSSLVFMVKHFIEQTQNPHSGFYLNNMQELAQKLTFLEKNTSKKILLLGVTFALLAFAQEFAMPLQRTLIMETGGMKGRQPELTRSEVHDFLRRAFQVADIHSEYGMTELLSQAYSQGQEIFTCPPTMQILLGDKYDVFDVSRSRKRGIIHVIDLANADSCAFIATQDIGEQVGFNQFKVLGRNNQAEIRGCNLMLC